MTDTTPEPADADSTAPQQPGALVDRVRAAATRPMRTDSRAEEWVFSFRDQVGDLLAGRVRDVDAYLFAAFRQIIASQPLMEATRDSLAGGLLLAATLGLEIGGPLGHYYLTPRWNKRIGRNECVPVIGYRGYFELGYRSGNVAAYEYVRVREGDHFDSGADSERGNWWEWRSLPGGAPTRKLTHVVAIAKLTNGQRSSLPMTIDEILNRRPTQWEKTPWGQAKFADAMATKTPFREQAKFLRLSTDLALAADADERISWWNQQTQAIETSYDDDPNRVDARNDQDAGGAGGSGEISERAEDSPDPAPDASQGRTAPRRRDTSGLHASEVEAVAREEGRELTVEEYERVSGWQAEQAAERDS